VGLFKVHRGAGGRREVSQIATPEEGKNTLPAEEKKAAPEVKKLLIDRPARTPHAGSPAYKALATGISKQSAEWAKRFIKKLTDPEEVKLIRILEINHPKHIGGRKTIIAALDVQDAEIAPKDFKAPMAPKPKKQEPEVDELACPQCEFKAGSVEGLEAHVTAIHDL